MSRSIGAAALIIAVTVVVLVWGSVFIVVSTRLDRVLPESAPSISDICPPCPQIPHSCPK